MPVSFATHVEWELKRAREEHPDITSVHAGYAIIKEELEEFWAEVKRKGIDRNGPAMVQELVQTAAMCQRVAEDLKLVEWYRPR